MGADALAQDERGSTPLHDAAAAGNFEAVSFFVEELDAGVLAAQGVEGGTPLHWAADNGRVETVRMLVEMGSDLHARAVTGDTPLDWAKGNGHVAVVMFLMQYAEDERRSSWIGLCSGVIREVGTYLVQLLGIFPVVVLLVLKLVVGVLHLVRGGFFWCRNAISASVASINGRRDNADERNGMARDAARHSEPYGEIHAHGGEENAGPAFNISDQGRSVSSHRFMASQLVTGRQSTSRPVECEAGTSHSGVEQRTTTQAERRQQKDREQKKQKKQRKWETKRATLEEALARVDTEGASSDNLDALEVAIACAKQIPEHGGASSSADASVASSCERVALPELLRQAEEKSTNLKREMNAVPNKASADDGNTCVVCLAAPKNSLLLPCKHIAMCAECTKAILKSSSQPQ
jgi:hypothetical protein